ncbi:G-type lectin S-receptor-like serine/threonine-protein kinase At5g24080 [Euphorbia peplus]|nr:G-type lectin S-receptor-like serine/threonine-protein kinase At5g24080 [Euphorbia peplus]
MDYKFFLIPCFLLLSFLVSYSASASIMGRGTHLSVENPADILTSTNGVFSAGFYPVGDNAYCFAIWFSKPSCNNNCTLVWMANRDFPVNGKHSKLILLVTGNLVLTDAGKSTAWTTDTVSASPVELRLHDNGNLVLSNTQNIHVWQSFDFPTDTLLPSQLFTRNLQLVSSRSRSNFSSGFYKLFFNDDNLIHLAYDGPDVSSVYWPDPWLQPWEGGRFPYNSSRIALFDSLGSFTSSDHLTFRSLDYGERLQRRLTLDSDGNLRLYSRKFKNPTAWVVTWQAKSRLCQIHGICGANSVCSYNPVSPEKCTCLPGYRQKKIGDWSFGCEPEFHISCGNHSDVGFVKLKDVEFYGNDDGFYPNVTLETCEKICSETCSCKGYQYRYLGATPIPYCYPKSLLVSGNCDPSFGADTYLKVSKTIKKTVSRIGGGCSAEISVPVDRSYLKNSQNGTSNAILWLAITLGGFELFAILVVYCFLFKSHKDSNEATRNYNLAANTFRRFTHSELKKASDNFSKEIGRGAGGTVYKGILADNRVVAIKQLNIANQGEEEFLAEMRTIGKLNHMNLIDMWGYCAEGKHRLLVYEYMEHGSLMENLSSKGLNWKKRFEIALGTARGLAYLHEECLEWVLHCDVKPQNILLDSKYQPKVSDFGLSKLLSRDDQSNNSTFSKIRGTRGYMAPEWLFNLPITSKVDVYSYGIVVLEMVTGKSAASGSQSVSGGKNIEQKSLVTMVREKRKGGDEKGISWMGEMIDPMLEGEYEEAEMEILIKVALQCVEEDKDSRPTMSSIVEMLLKLHQNDH